MPIQLGVVMDPIESINPKKDSTLAMLIAAQNKGWEIDYILKTDLYTQDGEAHANTRPLKVFDSVTKWFELEPVNQKPLSEFDVILMRVDPPFNMEYIYATYPLQLATQQGVLVVNNPKSLCTLNEKFYAQWFSDLCPPTLVTAQATQIKAFLAQHKDIVVKPLDGMGGQSIFRVQQHDANTNVILETITNYGITSVMAQQFIPEITEGDKRILLIDGEPIPYALARIPSKDEFRGNLAAGGNGIGRKLSDNDKRICEKVGPILRQHGILFAGLDVIGNYLTEINITSPTCIRELDSQYQLDIGGQLMDCIEQKVAQLKQSK